MSIELFTWKGEAIWHRCPREL